MLLPAILGVQTLVTLLLLCTPLFWWVVFILFVYGTLYVYMDDGPRSGRRVWTWFQQMRLWHYASPVRHEYTNPEALRQLKKPCLFVVMPNCTNLPLAYGFGLHGGNLPLPLRRNGQPRACIYLVPPLLFWVPWLRDLLLWSGAVADHGYDTVLDQINAGHCVAYSPNGMQDLLCLEPGKDEPEDAHLVIKKPDNQIFQFARENAIHIVPVLVYGELERYHVLRRRAWQQPCHQATGWPFPFWVFPRIFSTAPPPPMRMFVGNPMNPSLHKEDETFHNLFFGAVKALNNVGSDRVLTFKE